MTTNSKPMRSRFFFHPNLLLLLVFTVLILLLPMLSLSRVTESPLAEEASLLPDSTNLIIDLETTKDQIEYHFYVWFKDEDKKANCNAIYCYGLKNQSTSRIIRRVAIQGVKDKDKVKYKAAPPHVKVCTFSASGLVDFGNYEGNLYYSYFKDDKLKPLGKITVKKEQVPLPLEVEGKPDKVSATVNPQTKQLSFTLKNTGDQPLRRLSVSFSDPGSMSPDQFPVSLLNLKDPFDLLPGQVTVILAHLTWKAKQNFPPVQKILKVKSAEQRFFPRDFVLEISPTKLSPDTVTFAPSAEIGVRAVTYPFLLDFGDKTLRKTIDFTGLPDDFVSSLKVFLSKSPNNPGEKEIARVFLAQPKSKSNLATGGEEHAQNPEGVPVRESLFKRVFGTIARRFRQHPPEQVQGEIPIDIQLNEGPGLYSGEVALYSPYLLSSKNFKITVKLRHSCILLMGLIVFAGLLAHMLWHFNNKWRVKQQNREALGQLAEQIAEKTKQGSEVNVHLRTLRQNAIIQNEGGKLTGVPPLIEEIKNKLKVCTRIKQIRTDVEEQDFVPPSDENRIMQLVCRAEQNLIAGQLMDAEAKLKEGEDILNAPTLQEKWARELEGKKKEIEGRLPNGDADGEWQQVRELLEEGSQAIKNQDVARANKLMKKAEILTGLMRAPAEILTGTQRLHLQAILNQKPLTDEALGKADRLLEMFLHDQLIEQYRSQITNNSIRISNSSPRMNQVIFIEYTDWNLGGINQYLEYEWTFDDSLSEGGCKVPHFFAKEGNYGLQVRVRKELDGSVLGEAQIDRKSREAIKVRRSEREWYWWQRLTLLEGLINMGVILVAAIAAVKLFYTDTFGTFNDYISAFVWVFGINASTNFTFGDLIRARYPNTFAPPGQ